MSDSRYYPGRRRATKRSGMDSVWLALRRSRAQTSMELVDGEREFWDTWDQDRDVLDYGTGWIHEMEARFRNHRTRGAKRRDGSKPRLWAQWYPCGCILRCRRDLKICKFIGVECQGRHDLPKGYRYHIGTSALFMVMERR